MKRKYLLLTLLVLVSFLVVQCAPAEPAAEPVEEAVEEVVEEEVVEEAPAEPVEKVVVEFWTTDNEEDRVDVYEAVAADYMAANPNVDLRIVPIEEAGVTQRIATALAANRLPDIVRMGVERVAAFAADDILDEDAAEAVIASIGMDDFRDSPLSMVVDPDTGKHAAVPYDGWVQAIWYRSDVFTETLGSEQPRLSWADIDAACDALPGTENLLYALGPGHRPRTKLRPPGL